MKKIKKLLKRIKSQNWGAVLLLRFRPPVRATDLQFIWAVWSLFLATIIGLAAFKFVGLNTALATIYAIPIFVLRLMQGHLNEGAAYADQLQGTISNLSETPVPIHHSPVATLSAISNLKDVSRFFQSKVFLEECINFFADIKGTILGYMIAAFGAFVVSIFLTVLKSPTAPDPDWATLVTTVVSAAGLTVSISAVWIPLQRMAKRNDAFSRQLSI